MDHLAKDKLNEQEKVLVAPCGIFCGACDAFLGKSKALAKELHRVLDGFNIADVGPIYLNVEQERLIDFLHILKKISDGEKCPGCLGGGGNPVCPMKSCTKELGYLTCAECDKLPCHLYEAKKDDDPLSKTAMMALICSRYKDWNVENLNKIRQVGYRQFIDEMQEKVANGFLTSDVISSDMLMTEAFKKMG